MAEIVAAAASSRALPLPEWLREGGQFEERGHLRRRYVALAPESGHVVGYGIAWNTRAPRKYRVELAVRPAFRRRGVGSGLLGRLLDELRALDALTAQARARDDDGAALAFLERRGFVEVHRMVHLRLSLADVEIGALLPLARPSAEPGVTVSTLTEERQRQPDCLSRLHAAHLAARSGWPDPDPEPGAAPLPPQSLEAFVQELDQLGVIPEACYSARVDDEYVGYSCLARRQSEEGCLRSGGTAVRPEWRGRGIATLLKVKTVEYALGHGVETLLTSSANPAMVRINERVGFRRQWAEVRLVRRLQSGAGTGDPGTG